MYIICEAVSCLEPLRIKSRMHCIRCIANHSHGSKLSPKEAFFFNVYNFRVSDAYVLIYRKSIKARGPNLKSRDLLKTSGWGSGSCFSNNCVYGHTCIFLSWGECP